MNEERHKPRNILVTGGAGFIGSNLIHYLLDSDPSIRIINLDALTYAGTASNIEALDHRSAGRHRFVKGDICDDDLIVGLLRDENIDTICHLAAESHVDRSIDDPRSFIQTNVVGTCCLLEAARKVWSGRDDVRFHHVSTDEVYGSLGPEGLFREDTPYSPRSPYSASKASSDHLVRAWAETFGLNVTLSNCSNNFGPWQFPEKLIPLMISNCLDGSALPIYGDGSNVRDWLYVTDHCEALDQIIRFGQPGRTYNVGGGAEWRNIDLVQLLCRIMDQAQPRSDGASYSEQITFVQDRPGHDRRYAIDFSRIRDELGWQPKHAFDQALEITVKWYLEHHTWIQAIKAQVYDGGRLGLQSETS